MQLKHPRDWSRTAWLAVVAAVVGTALLPFLPPWLVSFLAFAGMAMVAGQLGDREKVERHDRDAEKRAYLADEERRHREARERRAAAEDGPGDGAGDSAERGPTAS